MSQKHSQVSASSAKRGVKRTPHDDVLRYASIHVTAQVKGWRGCGFCEHDAEAVIKRNTDFLGSDLAAEARFRKYRKEIGPGLAKGEKIPVGNLFDDSPWVLSSSDYFLQYIGADRDWWTFMCGSSTTISFQKTWTTRFKELYPESSELYSDATQMGAWISFHADVKPNCVQTVPFDRPKYASLTPIVLKLHEEDIHNEWRIWFLGNGYLRLEMDTEPYTGKPEKLMWTGIRATKTDPRVAALRGLSQRAIRENWAYLHASDPEKFRSGDKAEYGWGTVIVRLPVEIYQDYDDVYYIVEKACVCRTSGQGQERP